MVNHLAKRVLANKIAKGFPVGDIAYDCNNINNEVLELRKATTKGEKADELADIIIFALGIAAYEEIDIRRALIQKMDKIEKREITPLGDGKFDKKEGT